MEQNPQELPKQATIIIEKNSLSTSFAFLILGMFLGALTLFFYERYLPGFPKGSTSLPTPNITTTPTVAPTPSPTPTKTTTSYNIQTEQTLNLKNYQIEIPSNFEQIAHSSSFQNTETFLDNPLNPSIKIVINQEKNINPETKKPFSNLKDYLKINYDLDTLIVDNQNTLKVLPRAGSETDYKAIFFSPDKNVIFSILVSSPQNGSKLTEANNIFNKLLKSFDFQN